MFLGGIRDWCHCCRHRCCSLIFSRSNKGKQWITENASVERMRIAVRALLALSQNTLMAARCWQTLRKKERKVPGSPQPLHALRQDCVFQIHMFNANRSWHSNCWCFHALAFAPLYPRRREWRSSVCWEITDWKSRMRKKSSFHSFSQTRLCLLSASKNYLKLTCFY